MEDSPSVLPPPPPPPHAVTAEIRKKTANFRMFIISWVYDSVITYSNRENLITDQLVCPGHDSSGDTGSTQDEKPQAHPITLPTKIIYRYRKPTSFLVALGYPIDVPILERNPS